MTFPPPAGTPGSPGGSTRLEQGQQRTYRPELQGLRALAVLLVVVYHVWFGRVSGGVDVFFVISGFLITGGLFRAAQRGPLRLRAMWSRQAVRLVPAAATVLLAGVLAGYLLLPEARWAQTIREIAASALFVENWRLAADSVDYAASHNTQSLVQHFWSLSIQVQFYVLWPLLVAVVALALRQAAAGRASGRHSGPGSQPSLRTYLILAIGGLFVASLSFSIALTLSDQPLAYFHSLTRVWEFALGGLLALTIDGLRLGARLRLVLGWLGVAALIACGAVLQVASVFPGYAALWPTLAACAVLAAGTTGSGLGADRLLASRPARYVGDLSYTLYLWHWPVLILWLAVVDREAVGLRGGLLIIGVSVVLAVLTHHLVEKPLRRAAPKGPNASNGRGGLRVVATLLASVLAATLAWQVDAHLRASNSGAVGDPYHPGAMAMTSGFAFDGGLDAPLIPPLVSAPEDFSRIEFWDCTQMTHFPSFQTCASPLPDPTVPPARRIVVVGDSHAQQYTAALHPIAQQRNWQIITLLHGACPFSTVSEVDPENVDCVNWNAAAVAEIADLRPDLVFTLATRDVRAGLFEQTPPGFVEQWRRMDALGIPVLAVRDNPRFDFSPADCLQQSQGAPGCGIEPAAVYPPVPPYELLTDVPPNVTFLDFSDYLCTETYCPPAIGNVLVYMDNNHVSASYMTSLSPIMAGRMDQALGW